MFPSFLRVVAGSGPAFNEHLVRLDGISRRTRRRPLFREFLQLIREDFCETRSRNFSRGGDSGHEFRGVFRLVGFDSLHPAVPRGDRRSEKKRRRPSGGASRDSAFSDGFGACWPLCRKPPSKIPMVVFSWEPIPPLQDHGLPRRRDPSLTEFPRGKKKSRSPPSRSRGEAVEKNCRFIRCPLFSSLFFFFSSGGIPALWVYAPFCDELGASVALPGTALSGLPSPGNA